MNQFSCRSVNPCCRSPKTSNDIVIDARFKHGPKGPPEGLRSLLAVPLFHHNKSIIGLLAVLNSKQPGGFTESDQRLFRIIGIQAQQLQENARLAAEVRQADIVVAAAGVPGIITGDMVKPGAALLDVGVSRVADEASGRSVVAGDLAPDVWDVAGFVSPNPGGVGPMTRAMLLTNVVEAAERALT